MELDDPSTLNVSDPAARRQTLARTQDVTAHAPDSKCPRARAYADIAHIEVLSSCSKCHASKLHSIVASARTIQSIRKNFQNIVEQEKASINYRDAFGDLPIHVAAAAGLRVEEFKILQTAGADLHARNNKGETFLHVLASVVDVDGLLSILTWADNERLGMMHPDYDGKTVMHAFCEKAINIRVLNHMWGFFRSLGSGVNLRDRWGLTMFDYLKNSPLTVPYPHGATSGDSVQQLETVLANNLPDYESRTRQDMIQARLPADLLGLDQTMLARWDQTMLEIVQQAQTNPSAQAADGKNALHCLACMVRLPGSELQRDPSDVRHDWIRSCLQFKVNVNAYCRDGQTPLHAFCAFPRAHESPQSLAQIVATLLEYGADPHMKDRDGNTALHLTSINGHPLSVEVLLNWLGRDPQLLTHALSAPNDNDLTPADAARRGMRATEKADDKERVQQCINLLTRADWPDIQPTITFWSTTDSTAIQPLGSPPASYSQPQAMANLII